jgi:hypothetical protein
MLAISRPEPIPVEVTKLPPAAVAVPSAVAVALVLLFEGITELIDVVPSLALVPLTANLAKT